MRRKALGRPTSRPRAWVGTCSERLEPRRLLSTDVLRWHEDLGQTGLNSTETQLTPANVNPATFAKLFSYPVDGQLYAQPLYVAGVSIPGKGTHDLVIVATETDNVYAFDADNNSAAAGGGMLWHVSLGTPAPMPNASMFPPGAGNGPAIVPYVGVTGTPVIDRSTNTIYLDALTNDAPGVYNNRIHALDLATGQDKTTPTVVAATYPGDGVGGDGTNNIFSTARQMQRPALALVNGLLYVAYGSFSDVDPYHGWVLGFDPTSLQLKSVFDTTPNLLPPPAIPSDEGAIWQSGAGPASDGANLYYMTADGDFDAALADYGDSFIKLATSSNQLHLADYFTPSNQQQLSNLDGDLGSGGPMLLPDVTASAAHPHLLIGSGKQGIIYLIDTDSMGEYHTTDNVVQEVSLGSGMWSSPAYFNGRVYFNGVGDVPKAFSISNGVLSSSPVAQGTVRLGYPGATPTISANGTSNGIVWELQSGGVLHAFDANTLQELYNSNMAGARDQLGGYESFTLPAVADGKVFVGAGNSVAIFGLLPASNQPPPPPVALAANLGPGSSVVLSWTDTGVVSNYRIERSSDRTNFAQIATVSGTGDGSVASYADTPVDGWGQTFYYRVRAFNTAYNGIISDPSSVASINISSSVSGFTDTYGTNTASSYTATTPNPALRDSWTISGGTLNYAVQSSDNNWNSSVFLLNSNIAGTGGMAISVTSGDIINGRNYEPGLILSGDTTSGGFIVQEDDTGIYTNHLVLLRETGAQFLGDEGGVGNPPVLADFGDISAHEGDTFHIVGTIDRTGPSAVITVAITDMTTPSFTIAPQTVTDAADPVDFGGAQIGWRARYHDATAAFSVDNLSVASGLPPADHAPAVPSNLTAVQASTGTNVNLAWINNADNALSFEIERSTDGMNYVVVATVPPVPLHSTAIYTDTPLASPVPILYYRIRAFNGYRGGTLSAPGVVASLVVSGPTAVFLDDYHTNSAANYTETTPTAPPVFQDSWTVQAGQLHYAIQATEGWNSSVFLLNQGIANTNGIGRFTTSGDIINGRNYEPGLILSGDTTSGGFIVQEDDTGIYMNHLVLLRETGAQFLGDEGGVGDPPVLADFGDISAHEADTFHIAGTIDRSGTHPVITVSVTDLTNPSFTIESQSVTDTVDPANYGGVQIGWRARYQDTSAQFSMDNLSFVSAPPPNTIVGTSGNDAITLQQDSGHQFIVWTMGAQSGRIPINDSEGLTIIGNRGTDTITLDGSNGSPIPDKLRLNGTFVLSGSALSIGPTQQLDVGQSTLTIPNSVLSVVELQAYLKGGLVISSSAAAAGGRFALADTAGGSGVQLSYALIGDADFDGTIGFSDLLRLAQNYGATGVDWREGDFNYDGTVNFADLLALVQHYGQTAGSAAGAAASLDPLFLKSRRRQ